MEYKQAQSLIARLAGQIKLLILMVTILLLANVLLGSLLWHQSGHENIVLLPANLHQKANVTHDSVSSSYLEAIASMMTNERLNVTPENVRGSNKNLLAYVSPRYYSVFKKQLESDAKSISAGKISAAFYPSQIMSDPKKLQVLIKGELKRWVGSRLIGQDSKSYQLTFSRNGYLLLLTSFKEVEKS
jgi:conjugal transfer pilus assembly protein TraE